MDNMDKIASESADVLNGNLAAAADNAAVTTDDITAATGGAEAAVGSGKMPKLF